jgi:hypothetical protein
MLPRSRNNFPRAALGVIGSLTKSTKNERQPTMKTTTKNTTKNTGIKVTTSVKNTGIRVTTSVKAGAINWNNHNLRGLKVRAGIKAGMTICLKNHNQIALAIH